MRRAGMGIACDHGHEHEHDHGHSHHMDITVTTTGMTTCTAPVAGTTTDALPAAVRRDETLSATSLLQLMWLASPALPVGGFSYSEGLEAAVEAGHVTTEAQADRWLCDQLELSLARSELAVLSKAFGAWRRDDVASITELNAWVTSTRESQRAAPADRADGPLAGGVAEEPRQSTTR